MPFASPASLLAFTMLQMVALLYFNDSNSRPGDMSNHARAIFDNNTFQAFFLDLLLLPVPSFAANEFHALQTYYDDLANNLCFIPDLAQTTFLLDYGRHFPVSTFLALHNLMANLPANTTPASLSQHFYNFAVASVTFDNGANFVNVTPAMMFGLSRTADATTAYSNWLNERVARIVTALAIRPVFTAPTIGPIHVQTTSIANNASYNGYLFLSGLNNDNVNPLRQFASSMGPFVMSVLPNSRPLSLYTRPGTIEPARHLSFLSAGPTWSSAGASLHLDAFTAPRVTHRTYLEDCNYFRTPASPATAPDGTSDLFNTEIYRNAQTPPDYPLAQAMSSGTAPTDDPLSFVNNITSTSSSGLDLCLPPCIIFDPSSPQTSHLLGVITSGKIIETNAISSVSVLVARPDLPVHTTNASMLRYTAASLPQAITIGNAGALRVPLQRNGIVHALRALTAHFNRFFPAAVQSAGARWISHTINYFGYNLDSIPDATVYPESYVQLWSSYRYTSPAGQNFMIPSLRPIFGLRARSHVSAHPAQRIN
uniref:Coat protein n=1 Tax=Ceratobasidium partitivirus CP-h TaxID=1970107 RepID=A0A219WGJ9_9VIRU|nr:coat protein [Ceratobasidium partitivirus CP-h]